MACCSCAGAGDKDTPPDHADWMAKLPAELHNKPLNTIAIPGSHDSFTALISPRGGIAPNCPAFARDLCKMLGSKAKEILCRWSMTQSLDVYAQLKAGIRYLDLRVASKTGVTPLFMCHALYTSSTVKEVLTDIATFLNEHPKEVVLLDFNHFYEMDDMQHCGLLETLQDVFAGKLCPLLDYESTTLQNLWENNLQVIVFYHDPIIQKYMDFWPGDYIPSPWGNIFSTGKLINFLEQNYVQGRPKDRFYVTQGILTPNSSYVMKHLTGSLKKDLCIKAAGCVVQWVAEKQAGPRGINVVILDFVEMAEFISTVIHLNYS